MKGKFVGVIVLVLLLLFTMPVMGQGDAPDVTPTAEVAVPTAEYITAEEAGDLIVSGPGRAGTIYVSPVVDEGNRGDELVPYNAMLDDIALMMTALRDDLNETVAMAGQDVIPAQAQVIEDAPPVVVDDDERYQLILLTFGAVFVIFAGTIAYFGKLLFDSIPPALQDTMEYTLKRVAEGAVERTIATPATWDDELAQSFYDQVQAWFEDWRKINPSPDPSPSTGRGEASAEELVNGKTEKN